MERPQQTVSIQALIERLGYTFQDISLLKRALTHASARNVPSPEADNERLEFLGDRVLGLAIAELLLERYPAADEGELARRFNRLVRRETCASVGRSLKLGLHIIMSQAEAEGGGRGKKTILANACEAVLGAVFLDGGYEQARSLIRRLWEPLLAKGDTVPVDAKTALQEWAQARKLPLPRYVEISCEGPDHAPEFTAEVRIKGLAPAMGKGASKRAAEQAAAVNLLRRESVWRGPQHDTEKHEE